MRQPRAVALWSSFGAVAVVSSVLVMRRPAGDRLSDLHIYYGAMRQLQAGRPLYEFVAENGGPFTYPPFAALVLRPIAVVPEPVLRWIWLALTCAAVAVIAAVIGRVIGRAEPGRRAVVAAVACGLMISAPVQSNLRFGQVSIFVVLLALIDGAGLTPVRYRGVLVGVAAAVKLTPLLFVAHFLMSRQYREAGRAVVAFVACAGLGAVVLPGDSWTFWTGTIVKTSRIGDLASLGNQSVHGMLLRVGIAPTSLPVIWAVLVAVIAGVALLRARQLMADGCPGHAAVLVGCATVAASPVSWTHHQVWPVLAAMLLVGARGPARRVAGAVLLVVMTLSLGALLSPVSMRPGIQFLFENARVLGAVAVCVAGFGGLAVTASATRPPTAVSRRWSQVGVTAAAAVVFLAVQPLPAGADPTFKAYTLADVDNPRYFFVCRSAVECADFATDAPVTFGTATEKTKVRVNGVVAPTVARLEYQSAPGGAPRQIPLLQVYPGPRLFSFRSANMAHGRLVAYRADGQPLATYGEELAAAFRAGAHPRPAPAGQRISGR